MLTASTPLCCMPARHAKIMRQRSTLLPLIAPSLLLQTLTAQASPYPEGSSAPTTCRPSSFKKLK